MSDNENKLWCQNKRQNCVVQPLLTGIYNVNFFTIHIIVKTMKKVTSKYARSHYFIIYSIDVTYK